MHVYNFETYDVFTTQKFAGNQLAVVMDAIGLTDDEMQAITREFNLSETTFVFPPDDPAHEARIRIFTLGYEMPFAGHPTVGTSVAIARARAIEKEMVLELKAGLFPIRIDMTGKTPFAEFKNPNLPVEVGPAPAPAALEKALSMRAGTISDGACAPRCLSAGAAFVYAHAALEDVQNAKLDYGAFDAMEMDDVVGVLLYAEGGVEKNATYHTRMFAPNAGIPEDPATGSAAAALPGHVALSQTLGDGRHDWLIEQGYELGRPSQINAQIDVKSGDIQSIKIGGNAVLVQQGKLYL